MLLNQAKLALIILKEVYENKTQIDYCSINCGWNFGFPVLEVQPSQTCSYNFGSSKSTTPSQFFASQAPLKLN
jgi:hypothetical protein